MSGPVPTGRRRSGTIGGVEEDRAEEVRALAREKLDRVTAVAAFKELRALPRLLERGEVPLTKHGRSGLLAVTDRRIVFCRTKLLGRLAQLDAWPYEEVTSVNEGPGAVRIGLRRGELRFVDVTPPDRAYEIAVTVAGRIERTALRP
jgi:hypothetical protein